MDARLPGRGGRGRLRRVRAAGPRASGRLGRPDLDALVRRRSALPGHGPRPAPIDSRAHPVRRPHRLPRRAAPPAKWACDRDARPGTRLLSRRPRGGRRPGDLSRHQRRLAEGHRGERRGPGERRRGRAPVLVPSGTGGPSVNAELLVDPTPDELVKAIEDNWYGWLPLFERFDGGSVERKNGYVRWLS